MNMYPSLLLQSYRRPENSERIECLPASIFFKTKAHAENSLNKNYFFFLRYLRLKRSFIPSMSNVSVKRSVWSSGLLFVVAMT